MLLVNVNAVVVLVVIPGLIYKVYCEVMFARKDERNYYMGWCSYYLCQYMVYLYSNRDGSVYVESISSIMVLVLVLLIAYQGEISKKFLMVVLFLAIKLCAETLSRVIFTVGHLEASILQLECKMISSILLLLLVTILAKTYRVNHGGRINRKSLLTMLILPMGSVVLIISNFYYDPNNSLFVFSLMILIIMNMTIYSAYASLVFQTSLEQKYILYKQQVELCHVHMDEKVSNLREYRRIAHDMKHHYYVLQQMIRENTKEEIQQYIEKEIYNCEVDTFDVVRTGNVVIDSLLNHKYAVACAKEIHLQLKIQLPDEIPFELSDLSILLGNAIDNAIEAAEKVTRKKPEVTLAMLYDKRNLIIIIENDYEGTLKKIRGGYYQTSKIPAEGHGIGIESMERIVGKYRGHLDFMQNNQQFVTTIVLYQ
ncbi:MAG: ATP-binding protein [Eubacteriales bacterium]